ncbi:NADPH-dependent glutamate synthase [Mesoterricola sediminis]|uniref:2-polyprenylphenol hydroxylase n=1 Tax=Mesoterricola sediminis TaxID=2927980 RepID=A0AA48GU64_9BACT|nr:NADPH-dependent glutamate synthase [Mesoterricola sediminis]BDU75715.1 2-polyprenylphenol hydroxylase [Mesoterricola sediminis]
MSPAPSFALVHDETSMGEWHLLHLTALGKLTELDAAIAGRDWVGMERAARWIYEVLRPHNEAEERELLPLLEELGAEALMDQLVGDHREMWDLTLHLLSGNDGGSVREQGPYLEVARKLLDLVRQHIETEERVMLPLLKGKSLYMGAEVNEDGYLILEKELLAPETWSFVVQAPMVARGRKPGQFLMVAPFPTSERIPLTLADGDPRAGWIRFIMVEVGATTRAMGRLSAGDKLFAVAGPMGEPTELVETGTVVLVAGGYGSAAILPAAKALKARGQKVITILGGRSRERVLLAAELEAASDELIITTDDGSLGRKGIVTHPLAELIEREPIAEVIAVGPMPMMQAVSEATRPKGIFTLVSLNALMVDGTGMCGGCRVTVGGEQKFACFDGPDFDGHKVDFAQLRMRQDWYRADETKASDHVCNLGLPSHPVTDADLPFIAPVADLDWQNLDLPTLKPAQRMKIPRQVAACQEPSHRVANFREVTLVLNPEQARLEAARCLDCKVPKCIEGCPVNIDIPKFVKQIEAGNPLEAARILKQSSSLPAVCGRVCPQEKQCEAKCVVGIKGEPVAIGRLERFAADALLAAEPETPPMAPPTGKKVAVVGAGPAGLTVAGELAGKGHDVTVFDALHRPGGVLLYGIPEFRLPNEIVDKEVATLRRMGVKFVLNTLVGRSMTLAELKADYDAVFMGTGAGLPKMLGIPGEDCKGIYTANEFLTRINLMRADLFPETGTPVTVGRHVVVVGCGNTAMDAARAARRMGPDTVSIVYRRTIKESTARKEELEHTEEEGVQFHWLTNPIRCIGNDKGWITHIECAEMELTEPGPDGRRGVRATDRTLLLPCDTLVIALGFSVNPLLAQVEKRLETLKGGVVAVDAKTGETTVPGIFAGGDVITGGATVILAMGQGRRAAEAIHRQLTEANG